MDVSWEHMGQAMVAGMAERSVLWWGAAFSMVLLMGVAFCCVWRWWRVGGTTLIGERFRRKVVGIFALFVLVPCGITAAFSLVLVQRTLNAWFHDQARTAIQGSQDVAQGYLAEHERSIGYMASHMVANLEAFWQDRYGTMPSEWTEDDRRMLQTYLDSYERMHGVQSLVFFCPGSPSPETLARPPISKDIVMHSSAGILLTNTPFWPEELQAARKGVLTKLIQQSSAIVGVVSVQTGRGSDVLPPGTVTHPGSSSSSAAQPDMAWTELSQAQGPGTATPGQKSNTPAPPGSQGTVGGVYISVENTSAPPKIRGIYLMIARPVDPLIIERIHHAASAAHAYKDALENSHRLVMQFGVAFGGLCLLLLAVALWAGMALARQIIFPVSALIQGAQEIRQGRRRLLDERSIPATQDLRNLMHTFNSMVQDMTNRKATLEKLNRRLNLRTLILEGVLSGVSSGVLGATSDGVLFISNARARDLLMMPHEIDRMPLEDAAPEFYGLFEEALQDIGVMKSAQLKVVRLGHGRDFRVHILASRVPKTKDVHVILTFDDLTQWIAVQKKVAWSDVIQRVAHEIKNPLTPIALSAERLRRRYRKTGLTDPESREVFEDCIQTILRHASLIGDLVNEFVAFARMPAPQMKAFALDPLVRRIVRLYQEAFPHVTFDVALSPAHINADSQQIEQVLINVLKNALESVTETHPQGQGGMIAVSLETDASQVTVRVQDNGVGLGGVPEAMLAEYATTKPQGAGLGLAIVQKIVDAHGGRFVLMAGPDQVGAVACLMLPVGPLEACQEHAERAKL